MNQVLSVEQKKLIFQSVREKTGYSLSDCKEAGASRFLVS